MNLPSGRPRRNSGETGPRRLPTRSSSSLPMDTWSSSILGYGHPDHVRVHEVGVLAAKTRRSPPDAQRDNAEESCSGGSDLPRKAGDRDHRVHSMTSSAGRLGIERYDNSHQSDTGTGYPAHPPKGCIGSPSTRVVRRISTDRDALRCPPSTWLNSRWWAISSRPSTPAASQAVSIPTSGRMNCGASAAAH